MSKGKAARSKGTSKRGVYKDYWLVQVPNSPYWYRARFQPGTRSIERSSLGEADFDSAHVKLIAYVNSQLAPDRRAPEAVRLHEVLDWYWENHGKKVVQKNQQKIGVAKWKGHFGKNTVIADLMPIKITKFVEALTDEGLSLGYISRILGVGRSALNMARDNLIVSAVPKIKDCQTAEDREGVEPMGRPLELEELARLFIACGQQHVANYMVISMHTMARPAAVFDLSPEQVDFKTDRINMNPPGRRQTKKRRPLLRLTAGLSKALKTIWDEHKGPGNLKRYVQFRGRGVKNLNTAWASLVEDAGLAGTNVTLYSIRHTMGRELRNNRVPSEEIALFLGHKVKGGGDATTIYAPFSPDYLTSAAATIDAYATKLRAEIARQLAAPVDALKAA